MPARLSPLAPTPVPDAAAGGDALRDTTAGARDDGPGLEGVARHLPGGAARA